jgi:hypothetical protein
VDRGLSLSEAERKRIEEAEKEAAYQKKRYKATSRFVSALNDERALRVQRLLQGDLNSQTMWHIFELIEADIGGTMKDRRAHGTGAKLGAQTGGPGDCHLAEAFDRELGNLSGFDIERGCSGLEIEVAVERTCAMPDVKSLRLALSTSEPIWEPIDTLSR